MPPQLITYYVSGRTSPLFGITFGFPVGSVDHTASDALLRRASEVYRLFTRRSATNKLPKKAFVLNFALNLHAVPLYVKGKYNIVYL